MIRFFSMARVFALFALLMLGGNVFGQANHYEVYALKFGQRDNKITISDIAVGSKSKDVIEVFFSFWLIKGGGKTILVDAGFGEDADMTRITYTRPDSVLKRLNIGADDVTDIIVTHPHWDHIGGIDLFPNARVWIQKEDYNYFVGDAWQEGGNAGGLSVQDVSKIVKRNLSKKVTLVNGDGVEIMPGIKVFTGSKHTYEAQYVLVNTGGKQVILASDNSWYYYNLTEVLPIPVSFSAAAYTNNLKRMKKMVSNVDLIIPGHDPLVYSKFPKVAEGVVKIAGL